MEWVNIKDSGHPKKGLLVDIWSVSHGRLSKYRLGGTASNRYFEPICGGITCVRDATHYIEITRPNTN